MNFKYQLNIFIFLEVLYFKKTLLWELIVGLVVGALNHTHLWEALNLLN